ncbi:MAG: AAA family ATPase [Solirubrobacteraceae bacterium]
MRSPGPGLLERERELDRLALMIASANEGLGCAALIEGEAGIGKTSLVDAARELAAQRGMTVLHARGGELEQDFAWGVVRQLFDPPVGHVAVPERDALLEGAANLARPALGLEASQDSPSEMSFSTLHGLYWLTVNLAQRRPLMLVVDDLHWADRASLRFVVHLLPRVAYLPVFVLAAARPPSSEPQADVEMLVRLAAEPDVTVLHPAGLSDVAAATLVRQALSADATEDFCLACHEMSAGNPFLLRGLIADLTDEGIVADADAIDHVRRLTPEAISRSVLLRLARLPAASLPVARAVAVFGTPVELRRAQNLAELDTDDAGEGAAALIRAGILTGDGALAFAHPLVRSAVYGDLALHDRSRWHQRAARLLSTEGAAPEQLGPHLLASLPSRDHWTVLRLREVAADARMRGAPEIAVDCLYRALAEPALGQSRVDVLLELGEIEVARDPEAARLHLEEALAASDATPRRAAIALALGNALALCGRLDEAVSALGLGLAELNGDASPLRASLEEAQLGAARWEPSAQDLRRGLIADIRRRAASGTELDPRLHGQLAIEATAEGADRETAVHHAREALAAVEQPSTSGTSTVPEAILVLVFADLAEEARRAIEAWLALARRRAWAVGVVLGSTTAALGAVYRGAISVAIASARGAVAPGADIRLAPITTGFLVEALIDRGEIELARTELAERGLDGELPYAWATTPLLLARGRLHAAAGDHCAAIGDLLAAGERANAWGVLNPAMTPWRSSAAISLAVLGEHDRAAALAHEEIELARRWGAPRAVGVALRAAGVVHAGDEGLERLREAVAVLAPAPAPLEHARVLIELGCALRRTGHRAEAREHLRKGLDLAHGLGGIALADRAREELAIAGARPRRDALRGRDALTSSELRVAALAADGQTNRQIAEALFVTLRTVETHLTNSYAKLGIASRRGLAHALASQAPRPDDETAA